MDDRIYIERILYDCKDDFVDDFNFYDVRESTEGDIFTEKECNAIEACTTSQEQVEKLFFIIIYKEKNLDNFILAIERTYFWLSDKLTKLKNNDVEEEISGFREIRNLRDELPRHFDYNVHRLQLLWDIQQKLKKLKPAECIVVHGSLGYGKRWLALDACSSYSVMKSMDFKIFWLNVSKCKTHELVLEKLQRLQILLRSPEKMSIKLSDYDDITNKIEALKLYLSETLQNKEYKNSLLVLIDVPNELTRKAFDLKCKILITTRDKGILDNIPKKSIQTVQLTTGFDSDESTLLFAKVLDNNRSLPPEAAAIHTMCRGNPILISLIASNINEYSNNSNNRWRMWKTILDEQRNIDDDNYQKLIKQSLNELSNEYKTLFESLAIFKNEVNIPIELLTLYWNKPENEVQKIIKKFDKLYFVELDHKSITFSVQYPYFLYLKGNIIADRLTRMHVDLVNCYKIVESIKTRSEPADISVLPDDGYFHYYIAYHLKEANMLDVFPKLFLDLGFLEQKLRATGLPNTLGDLKFFRNYITNGDYDRTKFLNELVYFLPNVEEAIMKAKDTCLIQYALTTGGILKYNAIEQAAKFPYRVWFDDRNHLSKHRQVVPLPKKPLFVRFVDANTSLIALEDHSIMLMDLSTEYTVESTIYCGHKAKIIDVQLFLKDFFISLDETGCCNVWSIKNTPIERRRLMVALNDQTGSPRQQQENSNRNHDKGKCLQTIVTANKHGKIKSIVLNNDRLKLFVGTDQNEIIVYDWNDVEFAKDSNSHRTKNTNVHSMLFIPNDYLLLLYSSGKICFQNLTYSSEVPISAAWTPHESPRNLHEIKMASSEKKKDVFYVVFVFRDVVIQIKGQKLKTIFSTEITQLYSTDKDNNAIMCSSVSDDHKYLILGTKKGIVVFDPEKQIEIFRSSISDDITCVDMFTLENDLYKYILISGRTSGGTTLNTYGLADIEKRKTLDLHKRTSSLDDNYLCDKKVFLGGSLFNVNIKYLSSFPAIDNDQNSEFVIYAVDSRNDIHIKSIVSNKLRTSYQTNEKITTISTFANKIFYGCENGCVYLVNETEPYFTFDDSVVYLNCYSDTIMVAGTLSNYVVRINAKLINQPTTDGFIKKTFLIDSHLFIIKSDCTIDILNIKTHQFLKNKMDELQDEQMNVMTLGDCDILNNYLLIGTKVLNVFIYKINIQHSLERQLESVKHMQTTTKSQLITCTKYSHDNEYFAIGFDNGNIELYGTETHAMLQILESHNCAIYDLRFSPWSTTTDDKQQPVVLVSLSEQICFWNITFITNNPLDLSDKLSNSFRLSQRYNRAAVVVRNEKDLTKSNILTIKSNEKDFENGNMMVKMMKGNNESVARANNLWSSKCGPSDKKELLSCIKLIGSSAKQIFANNKFTQFLTIDDEGEIYFLRIMNIERELIEQNDI